MTLIPLISALIVTPEHAAAPAGFSGRYDPGAGHRPLAAALAIGVPALLVAAVALSPMVIDRPPKAETQEWTSIFLPEPKPPEARPDPRPQPERRDISLTTVPTKLPPAANDRVEVETRPYVAPAGSGTGPAVAEEVPPPARPPLVTAELDTRFAGAFQPDYPANERRREVEGVARVRVLIGTDGRVKAVELISADSPGFFEETRRRALAKWRFKPATRGGVAEESWKVMTVRFELRGA